MNEWRDTILYTSLTALAVTDFMPLEQAIQFADFRELARGYAWLHDDASPKIAGQTIEKPYNIKTLKMSAWFGTNTINVLRNASNYIHHSDTISLVFLGIGIPCTTLCIILAGGPRNIAKSFHEIIWDYPRKIGKDGGTTQTQRFLDGSKKIAGKLAGSLGGLAPQPGRGFAKNMSFLIHCAKVG